MHNENNLTITEKEFLWSLIKRNNKKSITNFHKLINHKNVIDFSISWRIEHKLIEFIEENLLIDKVNKNDYKNLNYSAENRLKKSLITYEKSLDFFEKLSLEKVKYVALKGCSYILLTNNFKRPVKDIDLLVDKSDIQKTVEIALRNGFKFQNHDRYSEDLIVKNSEIYDLPNLLDQNNICIEIHYKILRESKQLPCMLAEDMLNEISSKNFLSKNIKTANRKQMIIHLIYHATKKGSFDNGLMPFFDLYDLVRDLKREDILDLIEYSRIFNLSCETKVFLSTISMIEDTPDLRKKEELLKKIVLTPHVNTKIQEIVMEKNLGNKIIKIFKLIFVNKKELKREFQSNGEKALNLYKSRWTRQLNQFKKYIKMYIFNQRFLKRRAQYIKEFYE